METIRLIKNRVAQMMRSRRQRKADRRMDKAQQVLDRIQRAKDKMQDKICTARRQNAFFAGRGQEPHKDNNKKE